MVGGLPCSVDRRAGIWRLQHRKLLQESKDGSNDVIVTASYPAALSYAYFVRPLARPST